MTVTEWAVHTCRTEVRPCVVWWRHFVWTESVWWWSTVSNVHCLHFSLTSSPLSPALRPTPLSHVQFRSFKPVRTISISKVHNVNVGRRYNSIWSESPPVTQSTQWPLWSDQHLPLHNLIRNLYNACNTVNCAKNDKHSGVIVKFVCIVCTWPACHGLSSAVLRVSCCDCIS